jgi:tartrate dehydrogenase/decarboxylase / D-malate dehydrogenase
MLLDHLGHADAGRLIMQGIETVSAAGQALTPDLGGTATTQQVGAAIRAALHERGA